ncbi:ATP synthase membrane subunit K, mitochondrial-like [Acomys russatus]|uniref:ATP synthase membrane subunit K, mitochondrial-like n=1 Tax=Acomys russatus TaxID=60746 RepID=UPI0021E216F2|nr:ATP synthase membrane subunit K, mitochondrial-like [Acomys russatus]
MASPESDGQFQFTGIKKKYLNPYTLTGRMNCVLAIYGGIALLVLYFKLRPLKTPAVKAT